MDFAGLLEVENPLSAANGLFWLVLLSPGFLISYFRNLFISGRNRTFSESLLVMAVISSAYYSSIGLIFLYLGLSGLGYAFFLFFIIPILIGVGFGILYQRGTFDWLFEKLKLATVHPAETAWDFMFGTMKSANWIVVTLKDGTIIRGWYDRDSGASSNLVHKDIFIRDMRREGFARVEDDGRKRGVWISGDEIRYIEILPDQKE